MGNTATKESGSAASSGPSRPRAGDASSSHSSHNHGSTSGRARSRSNLGDGSGPAIFTISTGHGIRDREAERAAREERKRLREEERKREKERSLREESVDGGFLATHGVYTGIEDWKDKIVRNLIIERRLAPFWKGLQDYEEDWTDAQLYAVVKGLPMPGPDALPPQDPDSEKYPPKPSNNNLAVPTSRSRSHSLNSSDAPSSTHSSSFPTFPRSRSKTLSATKSNASASVPATHPEVNIPSRFVSGRVIEAVLYSNAKECPICFLYYPPYLNRTRCCDQEICSECFVQIKRADPHIPENHGEPASTPNLETNPELADQLISEPAACPFCKLPEFGVTYSPPPFRRGLVYANTNGSPSPAAMSNDNGSGFFSAPGSASPASDATSATSPPLSPSGRRRTVLPPTAPEVVTTDMIRPDWSQKLANARAHAARRAAAATALHTAAFLMGPREGQQRGDSSGGSVSRRLMRRAREGSFGATAGNSTGARDDSPNSNNSGSLTPSRSRSEQVASVEDRLIGLGFLGPRDVDTRREGSGNGREAPRGQGRRSRVEDLEEMMLMEAIRLSLLEEEKERRKREEEEAKKQPGSSSSTTQASTSASGTGTPLGVVEVESSAEGKGKKPERPAIESKGESSESMENNENEPMFNFTRLSAMLEAEGRDGKDGERLEHVENAAAHGEERRGA